MTGETVSYDVVVIGGGPVGENVADRAVQGGLSAVVVEDRLVGGECSYWACTPSKALLRPGDVRRAALDVDGARQAVTGPLEVEAVLRRRTSFASNWDDAAQLEWLDSAGIDLVRGRGRITAAREVTVTGPGGEGRVLTARHAVALCTGSRPTIPDIPGLREVGPWTNREALEAQEVPQSLLVIGGGVVGAELAGAFADLGAQVTMLVRSGLLGSYEPFAGELVGAALEDRGVDVRRGVSATAVRRTDSGIEAVCDDGRTVRAVQVVVATGREPQPDLGVETVGVGSGWLPVDETMRVLDRGGEAVEWLYAVGDANHRNLLTHQGKYQARAAGDAITARATDAAVDDGPWGVHAATADHVATAQVVFTDPQVASVGMTAAAAEKAGIRVRVVDQDLGGVAGAALRADDYTGQARMVVDEERGVVVGVTFVGSDVGEMLHAASIAVAGEVPVERLWHAVPAFPTVSEVWLRLLEAYGRPRPTS